ncbi:MAG: fibronectin type III domain-containing protein [Candidatus Bathyarchaeota archaeon]|nr:fibronectin type III domain-containing protein [Candidatus Bathyarchaeota archaeon]
MTLDASDTIGNLATTSWSFTVDTTPPEQVTGVMVTTASSSQLDVSWTAESDLDHYNVYRSTASGGPYDLVASPTTNSYPDTGLTASTTYYYIVSAVDKAGNEGLASNEAKGTTSEAPALPTMHIASIVISTGSKTAGRNIFVWGIALVTIVDSDNYPVEGATVYGHWMGATADTDTGVTDDSGQVSLKSDSVKNPLSGTTFTFVVDDVVLSGWTYDSSANVETSDSIIIP